MDNMSVSDAGHFVCLMCESFFEDLCNLRMHMGVHVKEVSPRSGISIKGERNMHNFSEKVDADVNEESLRCNVCHKGFQDVSVLIEHMWIHTQAKYLQCDICFRSFRTKTSIYNHMHLHISTLLCRCKGGHTNPKGKEAQPNLFSSADDLFRCHVCNRGFSRNSQLLAHSLNHEDKKLLKCRLCNETFENNCQRSNHLITHTYEVFHRCEVCFEIFGHKESHENHMRSHKSHCAACKMEFMDTDLLAHIEICPASKSHEHKDSHKGVLGLGTSKKQKVDCLKEKVTEHSSSKILENNSRIDLKETRILKPRKKYSIKDGSSIVMKDFYVSATAGKKDHKCEVCQKEFDDKCAFWHHMQDHSEEVPPRCRICLKTFEDIGSWKKHVGTKCKCALCGKALGKKDFILHMKFCPVKNPLKCIICCKRFSEIEVFKDHLRLHSKEESCKCKVCGALLISKYDTRKHNELHKKSGSPSSSMQPSNKDVKNHALPLDSSAEPAVCNSVPLEPPVQSTCFSKTEKVGSEAYLDIKEESIFSNKFTDVIKESSFLEDKKDHNDLDVFVADIDPNNMIMLVDEKEEVFVEEGLVDPLS